MHRRLLQLLGIFLTGSALAAVPVEVARPGKPADLTLIAKETPHPDSVRVFVIPVRDQIGEAALYVIRRGLKEAIEQGADAVVLDMKTPGGALSTTFEIMEALGKFRGTTLTYVNNEAMSAGAFIAATTDEIWFAPSGIIGAAAPVSSGGAEIEATMRQKIVSYLKARIRATTEGKGGYRGQVVSAMIDADTELKIEDKVLKSKGELLSLTAAEASKTYGDPAQPLLAAGIAKSLEELIAKKYPGARATVTTLELTWSENLAAWINLVSPVLLGIGLLALFIEFKTPGFGIFGIVGIACLAVVFLGNYIAGLSGHEPILFFLLGLVLLAVEIFFFPGVVVMAVSGLALMLGSLVWSMADLWPNEPLSVAWSGDAFVAPLANLGFGLLIAIALGIGLARFLPRGWWLNRLAVTAVVGGAAQMAGGAPADTDATGLARLVGVRGVAVTPLRPMGDVQIEGKRYPAKARIGAIGFGARVVVKRIEDFGLVVEEDSP